jgi:hypothetical protein
MERVGKQVSAGSLLQSTFGIPNILNPLEVWSESTNTDDCSLPPPADAGRIEYRSVYRRVLVPVS